MKIEKIAHLADIHIRKSPFRHDEYRFVFDSLKKSLKKKSPDRIVIVGDLFHDYIDLQPEATILAADFLNDLSEIAPVIITRGNHDIRRKAINRTDAIEGIVKTIKNDRVTYLNETGFFDDENVCWAVWKHGEKNNSPWKKRQKPTEDKIVIDLFHDPVNGAVSADDHEFTSKVYKEHKHFKGDYSFFGDIHLKQFLSPKKGYCGSLIEQNFSEGDGKFHGYLLWNIKNETVEEITIKNEYSYNTVYVNQFTDFDDLELELENPTKYNKIRVIWRTLPDVKNNDNQRKVVFYLKEKYNTISISHKNEFLEEDQIDVDEDIDIELITNQSVQHKIFKEYLEKIGVDEDDINEIIELDDEIASRVEIEELTNIEWSLVKIRGSNFMSYETIDIDWNDNDGLYQIIGLNTAGKTTLMKLITYVLYNKTKETEARVKFGDARYVNNRNDATFCEGMAVVEVNGEYFGIKRKTVIEKKRDGELKGAPTTVEFYKLDNPDDEFDEKNIINNLDEDERKKTQKVIESAIGTYENFMRVVMTTSDTLNEVLSSNPSEFIDALLYDSGIDLFDLKLKAYKQYEKEYMSKPRVTCNIETSNEKIANLEEQTQLVDQQIDDLNKNQIPEIQKKIDVGEEFIENKTKELNKIDENIYNLNIDDVKKQIDINLSNIKDLEEKKERIQKGVNELPESFDEEEYNKLLLIKDEYKEKENEIKSRIREIDNSVDSNERSIEQINGKVVLLKREGARCKKEISELKDSNVCPTCGQDMDDDHKKHTQEKIKTIEKEMFGVAKQIKEEESNIENIKSSIEALLNEKENKKKESDDLSLESENILTKIGIINDQINDVNKRKELIVELDKIDPQIDILKLKNDGHRKNIDLYNTSLKQIDENKQIELVIAKGKERLKNLKQEEEELKNQLYNKKQLLDDISKQIKEIHRLIDDFKEQERVDKIHQTYKKCIHRDGIPTQLLMNYAIPKINSELTKLLSNVSFDVWIDPVELRLKLSYNTTASIDAISGSGKERTFASVGLKFALNQINSKSKPTIFLLDEVMGKLTENSVEEFIEILNAIKGRMRKLLIVEHNHDLSPDYVFTAEKDENGISTLSID